MLQPPCLSACIIHPAPAAILHNLSAATCVMSLPSLPALKLCSLHAVTSFNRLSESCDPATTLSSWPQVQFYLHGMGLSPAQRQARLAMTAVTLAAVLAFFAAELQK